ncbi:MAG: hypothetical protein J6N52_05540 [Clostridia bacterium]|nr:hypothetical protein [Clostridia bacterium]
MIKRVVGLILVCMLAVSPSGIAASDSSEYSEEICNVLYALNIVPDYDSSSYLPFDKICKYEFAQYICNIMENNGYIGEYDENALNRVKQAGIVKDDIDRTAELTGYEAVTMLVRLLGYGKRAESGEGWPLGYLIAAGELGLLDGCGDIGDGAIFRHQAMQLLYNAIDADAAAVAAIKNDSVTYERGNSTILYEYRKIYKIKGIVDADEITGLRENIHPVADMISIDGEQYYGDGKDFLGYSVEAYVEEKDDGDEIVYLSKRSQNNELTIDGKDIKRIDGDFERLIWQKDGDRERRENLSPVISVIYNGTVYSGYEKTDFMPQEGRVLLIDNNDDKIYDVAMITDTQTMVVDYVSKIDKTISNKYTYDTAMSVLNLNDNDSERLYIIKNGKKASFEDLNYGDVLRVEKSKDEKEYITIIASDLSKTEKIISADTAEKRITTESGTYDIAQVMQNAEKYNDKEYAELKPGETYRLYFDDMERIAFAERSESKLNYAVAQKMGMKDGMEETYQIKLFTSEGKWETLDTADKIALNGGHRISAEKVYGEIGNDINTTGTAVIGYVLNSEGKISRIETALEDGSDERLTSTGLKNGIFRRDNYSLSSKTFLESDALVWVIRENPKDEEDYNVKGVTYLRQDTQYEYCAYNPDEYGFTDMLMITENESEIETSARSNNLFVVTSVGWALASDGTEAKQIIGYMSAYRNLPIILHESQNDKKIIPGDVIGIHTNLLGEADYIKQYYTQSDNRELLDTADLHQSSFIIRGIVTANNPHDGRMKINCGTEKVLKTSEQTPVLIYDSEENRVTKGTTVDIKTDDYVIVKIDYSAVQEFIVIK